MIKIHFITPFKDMVHAVIGESILKIAEKKKLTQYFVHDLFKYADPPHYRIDDYPFGGGAGMVMKPEPLFRIFDEILDDGISGKQTRVIFPTPDGKTLNQEMSDELSKCEQLIFINGHYKGIDQRVRDNLVTDEISIGDYVLTGGELPALIIADTVIRRIPGVINTFESAETDSFSGNLLDHPHFTRPEKYRGMTTPEILLSGHHRKIAEWKLAKQVEKTKIRRPDLYKKYLDLTKTEK